MNQYVTRLLKGDDEGIAEAGALLKNGELVGIPTETVYGLAANALDGEAVGHIFEAKGRPQDNPLIVHITEFNEIKPLVEEIPESARKLAKAYWPGPLTMIFRHSPIIPHQVSAGLDTVAIRMPSHTVARAIIKAAGVPLAAPSANLSGSPSPTTAARVLADMNGRIPAIVDGGDCSVGVESTVINLTGTVPCLLRPGGITLEMLQAVLGEVDVNPAVTAKLANGAVAASPGMKYKHYAPKAHVILVKGTPEAYRKYVNAHAAADVTAMCFDGEEKGLTVSFVTYGRRDDSVAQAHQVFETLRELDDRGAHTVYCACPSADGVGLAVYNRLLRAAGFEVITVD